MATEKRANYFLVFIILAAFTIIETMASYLQQEALKLPILITLSVIKVLLVLLYFMHLKFDSKVFSYLFIAGCILAIPLVLIMTIIMPQIV
jgi:cytochrome c oxidase subunit 4